MNGITMMRAEAGGLTVERLRPEGTAEAMDMLRGIAGWLKSSGSLQWNGLLRGEDSHGLEEAAARGEAFLFRAGSKASAEESRPLAGMVILLQQPGEWDKELWGEQGHEPYLYLHRLAVNRDYAGQGIGAAILSWAETGAACEGKSAIRLDCIGSNDKLNAFYSGFGYTFMGRSDNGFCLYQKEIR